MTKTVHELEEEEKQKTEAESSGSPPPQEEESTEGNFWTRMPMIRRILVAVLIVVAVLVMIFALRIIFGGDGAPPAPPPTEGGAGPSGEAPVVAIPSLTVETAVTEAPVLRFEENVDFKRLETNLSTGLPIPKEIKAGIFHEKGRRTALAFDDVMVLWGEGVSLEDRKRRKLPTVVRNQDDCFAGLQVPQDAGLWCEIQIQWAPGPGEDLDAVLSVRYSPWDDTLQVPVGEDEATVTIERLWDPVTISVPLKGSSRGVVDAAVLAMEPELLDFGSAVPPGGSARIQAEISIENRPATIESIVLEGLEESAAEMELDVQDCEKQYLPGSTTARDWCLISLVWSPAAPGALPENAALFVVWVRGEDPLAQPDRFLNTFPLRGDARVPPPPAQAIPPQITISDASRGPDGPHGDASFMIQAGLEPLEILSARLLDVEGQGEPRISLGCPPGASLPPERSCEVTVQWGAFPGARGSAQAEVQWRTDVRSGTERVAIFLDVPRPPAPALDEKAQLVARMRANMSSRRTLPVLQPGIGILTTHDSIAESRRFMAAQAQARIDALAQSAQPPLVPRVDVADDWTSISIAPGDGVSSRPVVMAATVLRGTPIAATIAQTIDAKLPTTVVAIVAQDIYSAHGRNVIVPRGSRVFGETVGGSGIGEDGSVGPAAHMLTARQGRVQIVWSTITRPDGVAFNVKGNLSTGDVMGRPGVLGTIDSNELSRYAQALIGRGFPAAAQLLLGGDVVEQFGTVAVPQVNVEAGQDAAAAAQAAIPSQILTGRDLAVRELQDGLREIAAEMSSFQIPPPTLTVSVGTPITLTPQVDLWLRKAVDPAIAPPLPEPQETNGPSSAAEEEEEDVLPPATTSRRPLTPQEVQALQDGNQDDSLNELGQTGFEGTLLQNTLEDTLSDEGQGARNWDAPPELPVPEEAPPPRDAEDSYGPPGVSQEGSADRAPWE